jgi:hypothetical protein
MIPVLLVAASCAFCERIGVPVVNILRTPWPAVRNRKATPVEVGGCWTHQWSSPLDLLLVPLVSELVSADARHLVFVAGGDG